MNIQNENIFYEQTILIKMNFRAVIASIIYVFCEESALACQIFTFIVIYLMQF